MMLSVQKGHLRLDHSSYPSLYFIPPPLCQYAGVCLAPMMKFFSSPMFSNSWYHTNEVCSHIVEILVLTAVNCSPSLSFCRPPLFLALYSTPSPPLPAGVCKHPLWSKELAYNIGWHDIPSSFCQMLARQCLILASLPFYPPPLFLALYSTPSPPVPAGVCKHPLWCCFDSKQLASYQWGRSKTFGKRVHL